MSEGELFRDLSLVVVVAAAISLIMQKFKQPLIVGYIFAGIISGWLFLWQDSYSGEILNELGRIGVALLLFIVGFELNRKTVSRLRKPIFLTTFVQVGLVTAVGMAAALMFNYSLAESLFLGLALSFSSTIVAVKLFSDKKEATRLYAQIAIGILIVQDIISTIVKMAMAGKDYSDPSETIFLIARGLALVGVLILIGKLPFSRITKSLERNKEMLVVFALAWGLGFAYLFETAGLSLEIGALFAGIALSSAPYVHEIASRLKPLRDFFILIFFIMLGSSVLDTDINQIIIPSIIFSIIVLLFKPLVIMLTMGFLGYTKRSSFKAGLGLAQVSEFSLIFIVSAAGSGLIGEEVLGTLSLVAIITFVISAYLIQYDDFIFARVHRRLRLFESRVINYEKAELSHGYPIVLFGYFHGGQEFIRTFKSMNKRFVVVDYDPEAIELLEREHVNVMYGDVSDPELIDELQLGKSKFIVSTISDFKTNEMLVSWVQAHNPRGVVICSANTASEASKLYACGAEYVMMPHFIGSEKISTFIKRAGFKKSEFHKYRNRHLQYLETHYSTEQA